MDAVSHALKMEKLPSVYGIPVDLLKHRRGEIMNISMGILKWMCQKENLVRMVSKVIVISQHHCRRKSIFVSLINNYYKECWKYDLQLEIIKKMMFRWFGHVVRKKWTLERTILQGQVEGWGEITGKASMTAIGRSKGIDRLRLCEIWKEAEDRVLCRKRVSREAPKDWLVFRIQDKQRAVEDTH